MAYEEDKQSALTRALIMAGAAMTQPGQGGFLASLGRGGMMGLNAYDNTFEEMNRRRLQEEALRRSALEDKLKEIALARQQSLAGIFNQFGSAQGQSSAPAGPRPSMMDAPDWKANPANPLAPNAAPSARAQAQPEGTDPAEDLIKRLAAGGFPAEAKAQLEVFKGLEGEVYGEPQVDREGRVYVNTKRGPKYIKGGFVPRDKLVEVNLGGEVGLRGEYDTNLRGTFKKTMTPGEKASNAVAWANYYKPELRESGTGVVGVAPDGKGGVRVTQTDIPRKAEKLPSGDAEKLLTLDEMVSRAKWAKEGIAKNPDAVGPANAITPAWVLNMDKTANVDTRARLSELSTYILNARSGAAVTEHEYKRLEPFLATANDNANSAKTKLNNLIKTMDALQKERRAFYTSQGYNVPPPQFGQTGLDTSAIDGTGIPGNMSAADVAAALRAEIAKRGGK